MRATFHAATQRSRLGNRLLVTVRARNALRELCTDRGPQHIVLSWPSGVTTIPADIRDTSAHDVIVGHVAGCPIYVDLRQLVLFRDRRVLLDVQGAAVTPARPLFNLTSAPLSGRSRPVVSSIAVA